jgi:hypothetical protein
MRPKPFMSPDSPVHQRGGIHAQLVYGDFFHNEPVPDLRTESGQAKLLFVRGAKL